MNENEIDDGLTPEERAAIASDDDLIETDDEGGDDADASDQENGAQGDDEAGDDAGDGVDAAAAADPAIHDDAGADTAADAAQQPAVAEIENAPILVAQTPEDADAKLTEIASKKDSLLTQFDDGEITAREYQNELDKLNKEERQIELAIQKAQIAAEMEQQRQMNEWNATVKGFISENPRYNPKTSPRMYQMLDMEVRAVAQSDEFKNRTDSAAGRLILQRAHENLAKEIGFAAKPAAQATKAAKPNLPPSLHNVPAADNSDVTGGKWAVLDRLQATDPIRYEDELMKLSDRDREAYLSA